MIHFAIEGLGYRLKGKQLLSGISAELSSDYCWAITGASGSGKTLLARILAGEIPSSEGALHWSVSGEPAIVYVPAQHDFRRYASGKSYYQQRYDSNYHNGSMTVTGLISKLYPNYTSEPRFASLSAQLQVQNLFHKCLIELSNGENKRLQLLLAVLYRPQLLLLDEPMTGLDVLSREILVRMLANLQQEDVLVVLITSASCLPECIQRVLELKNGSLLPILTRAEYQARHTSRQKTLSSPPVLSQEVLNSSANDTFKIAVQLEDVSVSYGEKKVLEHVSWTVKKGERWALLGPNGSGKSTLLSLLNGDNPQAYRHAIVLFDQLRGSGESIWDLKKKIGYFSPELHHGFQRDASQTLTAAVQTSKGAVPALSNFRNNCLEIICSGFLERLGVGSQVTSWQTRLAKEWMLVLEIGHLASRPYASCSMGEQRLVMLARTLVKNPSLLIFDEPCQGLDPEQTARFVSVTEAVVTQLDKTLIYVSHYVNDIPPCVTMQLILEKGSIKEISAYGAN